MPRAQTTIRQLMKNNNAQLERIFELEIAIEEAASGRAPGPSKTSAPTPVQPKAPRARKVPDTAEEALELEEQALKAFERRVAPIRASRPPAVASAFDAPPPSTRNLANSPAVKTPRAPVSATPPRDNPLARSTRTPGAGGGAGVLSQSTTRVAKTPSKTPQSNVNITNALVSQTPRTAKQPIDRFSPLRFLGTPRAGRKEYGKSGLRESFAPTKADDGDQRIGRGIFAARPSRLDASVGALVETEAVGVTASDTPGLASSAADLAGAASAARPAEIAEAEEADETIRFPRQAEPVAESEVNNNAAAVEEKPHDASPAAKVAEFKDVPGMYKGVFVDHACMTAAAAHLVTTMSDVIRVGLPSDGELPRDTDIRTVIDHLLRISRSDPDPPAIASSASVSSYASGTESAQSGSGAGSEAKAIPITQQAILGVHAILAILRSLPPSADDDGVDADAGGTKTGKSGMGVGFMPLKQDLAAICLARGWERDEPTAIAVAQRIVYWTQAKRAVRIDRLQHKAEGGKVMLPI